MYGEALRAVEDYAEAPFLVRRREGKGARAAVSTQISAIQSRLALSRALLDISADARIAASYRHLVGVTKNVAGAAMSSTWRSPRIRRDADIPCPHPYDRTKILAARREYLQAIRRFDRGASRRVNGS
ncbi:hypothetical protein ACNPNP_11985 [Microbacterium sp. AGC85]